MSHRSTIRFVTNASSPKNGIALIYDLEGFTNFSNQPDVQNYVPLYLNHVSEAMSTVIYGGKAYWHNAKYVPLLEPNHEKFLGDGALYIWTSAENEMDKLQVYLCNRLWILKNKFQHIVKRATDEIPIYGLPKRIRFGLARGTVYELRDSVNSKLEYIGICLNLASRLQSYCPQLGFIASARLGIPQTILDQHRYMRVTATELKGFPKENVIVDGNEFKNLDQSIRSRLFEEIE